MLRKFFVTLYSQSKSNAQSHLNYDHAITNEKKHSRFEISEIVKNR